MSDLNKLSSEYLEQFTKPSDAKAMLITCVDPRIDTIKIFKDAYYVHRTVAAFVPPYQEGVMCEATVALELCAKMSLSRLIVLGHQDCGGVKALKSDDPDQQVASLVAIAQGMECEIKKHPLEWGEKQCVLRSIQNILTYPWIKAQHDAGLLEITGMHISEDGVIEIS